MRPFLVRNDKKELFTVIDHNVTDYGEYFLFTDSDGNIDGMSGQLFKLTFKFEDFVR